jgi:hypothetical protein
VVEHVGQRGRGLQHVVHRAEQGSVRGAVDRRLRDRGREQAHVVPAVLDHPPGGYLEHLRGGVDPDDGAGGADLVLQQRQAQPGAAADVENGVAGPGGQSLHHELTPAAEGVGALVVVAYLAAVRLRPCRLPGGRLPRIR